MNALGSYLRSRASECGLSLAELARRAGKSRQTLHSLSQDGARLPELETLVALATALQTHPLRLIQLVFEDHPLPAPQERRHRLRGDKSIFLADVTVPDGMLVLAGSRFTKVWEVQNVGTVAWEDRVLRCMDEEIVVTSHQGETLRITEALRPTRRRIDVPRTAPGDIVRLEVEFRAPTIPGTCVSYWKTFFQDGRPCFPHSVGLSCRVRVMTLDSTRTSESGG